MSRRVIVEIVADSTKLERAFARSAKSATKFNQSITRGFSAKSIVKAGVGIASVDQALQASANTFRSAISGASDLNEQMSKTDVVFGGSADAVQDWSRTTAASF